MSDVIRALESVVEWFYSWFGIALALYMAALLITSLVLVAIGWVAVDRYVRMRPLRDYRFVDESPLSMPVTVIVPAYNEAPTIVDSVRSLLHTQFNQLEVIVVNDGSTDSTLDALVTGFDLLPSERVPRSGLPTEPIRSYLTSPIDTRLVVIDKENGGKADALNAGVNHAHYPLVCAVDADTVLDPGALGRLVWEFEADPSTVATGGIVRIVNGSTVDAGRITTVGTPRGLLGIIQIVEYLRAFLGGRLAWSRMNALLVISGAFGLFRREALVAAGGYDPTTVTEDAELILRLHRYGRDHGSPCRITFFPDPVCWTEAPSSLEQLSRQRDRWHRGLGETLLKHRGMLLRRRYGRIGWLALPYYWLFEFLEPVITVVGMIVALIGLILGVLSPTLFVLLLALTFSYGFIVSMLVILIEERAFRRYPSWRDLARLAWGALAENFGYRQWQALVRLRAVFRIRRSAGTWGDMPRTGFTRSTKETA